MLRTPFCELLGIDVPIIQAPAAPYVTPELVATVSNAGGLGSYPTAMTPLDQIERDIARIRELTNRPFAINILMHSYNPDAFEFAIREQPVVISFAGGLPVDLIARAREAGCKTFVQIQTVERALEAKAAGADVIIAQGAEAGGLTGEVSLMPLLPQVVDAVAPTPVIAAGGIADGRGLAAALVLGAQGVNVGTRFLATVEAAPDDIRAQRLVRAQSEDTTPTSIINRLFPAPEDTYPLRLRSLRTPFIEEWEHKSELTAEQLEALQEEVGEAIGAGRMHEYAAGAGESVGMIEEILPAAEIIRKMLAEAEHALTSVGRFSSSAA
jgi:enoyl-[acyl-carrier protein] reductase II